MNTDSENLSLKSFLNLMSKELEESKVLTAESFPPKVLPDISIGRGVHFKRDTENKNKRRRNPYRIPLKMEEREEVERYAQRLNGNPDHSDIVPSYTMRILVLLLREINKDGSLVHRGILNKYL